MEELRAFHALPLPSSASVEDHTTAGSPDDEDYETASPEDEDSRLAQELHAQELHAQELHAQEQLAEAAEAAEAESLSQQLAESAAVAMELHEQEMAAVSEAAEPRDRQAQARRAAEEAASEALVQELQQYEAYGQQVVGSAMLQSQLQAESDAEVALQMQREECALPSPAVGSRAAVPRHDEEAHTIRRHLFQPSARLTGIAGAASSTPGGPCIASAAGGGSYASAAAESPRNVHASVPAPAISLPLPLPSRTGVSRRLQLVVDGANVGWAFGSANGGCGFCADGMLHCVEYWRAKGVRPEAIAVVLHSRYYYVAQTDEAALRRLEAMGVLNWSPQGHDDDLFMLQLAADADAWVVSNDAYANHRSVSAGLRRRLIPYMWAGFGTPKSTFTPKADKCSAFERSRVQRSN